MSNYRIYKETLNPEGRQQIKVPKGAQFLHVGEQYGDICVWFKCDSSAPLEKRGIIIVGTGHDLPSIPLLYLGTAHLNGGKLILHVFEAL